MQYKYEKVWKICRFKSEAESKSAGKKIEVYAWFYVPVKNS